jgi:hypothetical protein
MFDNFVQDSYFSSRPPPLPWLANKSPFIINLHEKDANTFLPFDTILLADTLFDTANILFLYQYFLANHQCFYWSESLVFSFGGKSHWSRWYNVTL